MYACVFGQTNIYIMNKVHTSTQFYTDYLGLRHYHLAATQHDTKKLNGAALSTVIMTSW